MNGEYVRVTPDELDRALEDLGWALALVEDIRDAEEKANLPAGKARHLSTHKAWHAIAFLLEHASFPVDIVYGEARFSEDENEDNDWGYGPPRYLTPERVRTAAEALADTSFETLVAGVIPATLAQADLYPQVWDESDSLEWVRSWYEPLVPYFAHAAERGEALLIWLD